MNCFVTGGAGFIGSHLVDCLLADGHAVTIRDGVVRTVRYLKADPWVLEQRQ